MDGRYFSFKVVEWYKDNHRKLPWRETKDPYYIWLSEIILQQTRVSQGLPYYQRFVERFPTVNALAAAPEQEVLRLWEGLGYYTRARNLHKCAKVVVADLNGVFPNNFNDLRQLPGIGDYTAAAIASFAFKESVAVVDGNVYRVLARIFGMEQDIAKPETKKIFTEKANKLIDPVCPDLFNQAVMEFGAMHCTPLQPGCASCIFETSCFANKHSLQLVLPVKSKAKAARKRYFYYFVIRNGEKLSMNKREHKDIWHGLYDFYLAEREAPTEPEKIIKQDALLKTLTGSKTSITMSDTYKHILSHQTILAKFVTITPSKAALKSAKLKFYSKKEMLELPKPILISKFLIDQNIL